MATWTSGEPVSPSFWPNSVMICFFVAASSDTRTPRSLQRCHRVPPVFVSGELPLLGRRGSAGRGLQVLAGEPAGVPGVRTQTAVTQGTSRWGHYFTAVFM